MASITQNYNKFMPFEMISNGFKRLKKGKEALISTELIQSALVAAQASPVANQSLGFLVNGSQTVASIAKGKWKIATRFLAISIGNATNALFQMSVPNEALPLESFM